MGAARRAGKGRRLKKKEKKRKEKRSYAEASLTFGGGAAGKSTRFHGYRLVRNKCVAWHAGWSGWSGLQPQQGLLKALADDGAKHGGT